MTDQQLQAVHTLNPNDEEAHDMLPASSKFRRTHVTGACMLCLCMLRDLHHLAEGQRHVLALLAARKLQTGDQLAGADGKGRDRKGHKEGWNARSLQGSSKP